MGVSCTINCISKGANSVNNGGKEIKFVSFDERDGGKCNGVAFGVIS